MGVKSVYVVCDNCGSTLRYTEKLTKCKQCSQAIPAAKLEEAKKRVPEEANNFKGKKTRAILKRYAHGGQGK